MFMTMKLIKGVPQDVEDLIYDFLGSKWCTKTIKRNPKLEVFNVIFANRMPSSSNDFSDETFVADAVAIKSCKHYVASELKRFYCYLIDNDLGSFNSLTMRIINMNSVITQLQNGFSLETYTESETAPISDKWLLIKGNECDSLDFTAIGNPKYRPLLKSYYWLQPVPTLKTKASRFIYLASFLNYISDDDDPEGIKVSTHTILSYKRSLLDDHTEQSAFVILNGVKDFLHFVDNLGLLNANEYLFSLMKMTNTNSKGDTEGFSGDEVERIVQEMTATYQSESNPDVSTRQHVLTIMFLYLLNSPMRPASLMSCRVSDLHESKSGGWYYEVDTKVQEKEKIEIPNELRPLHDELLQITKPYRNMDEKVADYLFIIKRQRGGSVTVVCYRSDILSQICSYMLSRNCSN